MSFLFVSLLLLSSPFAFCSSFGFSETIPSSVDELVETFRAYVSSTTADYAAGLPVVDSPDRKYLIAKISSDLNWLDAFVLQGARELFQSAANPKREAHLTGVAMYLVQAEFLGQKVKEIADSLAQIKALPGDERETRGIVLRTLGRMRRVRQKFSDIGSSLEAELPLAIELIERGENRVIDDSVIDLYGNFVAKETYVDNLSRMLSARDRLITETAPLVQFQV